MKLGRIFALWLLFGVVITNYLAQIPYAIHLYGARINPVGAVLLLVTLAWFLVGFWLVWRRSIIGYWLAVAFLVVQSLFYFHNDIILGAQGYGLIYHLTQVRDPVLWWVFLIGDINGLVAVFFVGYFVVRKAELVGRTTQPIN